MARDIRGLLARLRAGVHNPGSAGPSGVASAPDLTSTSSMFCWAAARQAPARPDYLWGTLHAGRLAKALGNSGVTVIEFGVAGGNGLLALERAAEIAEELLGVAVRVVGFDSGTGMPPPVDERDIPWAIQPGVLPMDEAALRSRLTRADLVLGELSRTLPSWLGEQEGIVGFVSFDLDLYSSTMAAFQLFDAPSERLLPRVACYFDDIFGYGWNDFTGERAAIRDFNDAHDRRKLSQIYGLKFELPEPERSTPWPEKIYLAHIFDSKDYNSTEWRIPESWVAAHKLDGG